MIKSFIVVLLLTGCARMPSKKSPEEEVSVTAALNQAQMSYLKGCVEAFKSLKLGPSFDDCRDKAINHRLELQGIMNYNGN